MKLSDYAKDKGITYLTAFRHWQKGYIKGEQLPSGTIIVHTEKTVFPVAFAEHQAVLYARVSSSENKTHLNAISRNTSYQKKTRII